MVTKNGEMDPVVVDVDDVGDLVDVVIASN